MVWVNSENVAICRRPFGGVKVVRHRPRRRRLQLRFLHGNEEHLRSRSAIITFPSRRLGIDSNADPTTGFQSALQCRPRFSRRIWRLRSRTLRRLSMPTASVYAVTATYKDALHLRAIEERNHHSGHSEKARPESARDRLQGRQRGRSRPRANTGSTKKDLPAKFVEIPHQGRTLHTADPHGMPLEFYFSMDQANSLLQKYGEHRGARIQRIDHVNCFTPDVQASVDFYTELGFRATEYTETEDDDPKLWAVWMHRKGNVHDLAFTSGTGRRCITSGCGSAQTPTIILNTCDVLATTGWLTSMERGPGRHGISNAFFFTCATPTVTASSSSRATTSPLIPTSRRRDGLTRPAAADALGASRAPNPGSKRARCFPVSP